MLKHIALFVLLCAVPAFANCEDYATRMTEATVKVFNRGSTATGFFVRPPVDSGVGKKQLLLVTAGHVFQKMSGDKAIIVFRKAQADGTYTRFDREVKVRDGDKPLWTQNPDYDIAVLPMDIPDKVVIAPISFDSLADEQTLKQSGIHIGSDLLVLGYPLRVEANGAGFPIARHGSIAGYPLWPVKKQVKFLIDFTTFAGDSGGPVFIADPREKDKGEFAPPLVLGIVLAQIRHDERLNTLNEEETVHYPMHLSEIIHAAFVRDTIEQLKKKVRSTTAPATTEPVTSE